MSINNENSASDIFEQLRTLDPERYTACLYLPEEVRTAAATVYVFDAEIARIPDLISEPMPGEIRIQFWKDLLAKGDSTGGGPLAEQLLAVIEQYQLPKETFHNYLNARIFDLYQDPMPDIGSFEGYLGETHSALLQMIALCLKAERSSSLANACGHAGVAFGIARLLAGISWHHHNRRIYVPVKLLKKKGFSGNSWLDDPIATSHISVVEELVSLARTHLKAALQETTTLSDDIKPVFLPLAFVEPTLRKIEKSGPNLFNKPVQLSNLKRQWLALLWAMKT